MEFVGQPGPLGACGFLAVPGLGSPDADDDEGEVVIGIRPKCSPLPRRRSSVSDDELEPGPPLSGSRRVSFADAVGLDLVKVKEFGTWDIPMLPFEPPEVECINADEFYLSPLNFPTPLPEEELCVRIQEQKVELETVELLPGTTIVKGIVRVQNVSFNKAVYVRTTLDSWSSHFDLLTEYLPDSSNTHIDRFSFKLTLVPPFGEQGARVDFCLRYETPMGTFWANNNSSNYVLFCHQRAKHREEKPKKEIQNKKSCLRAVSQTFPYMEDMSTLENSADRNTTTDESKHDGNVDTVKKSQNSDGQLGPSEEERKKLQAENRRNCNSRNRRKAARLARVKDYFAQKDGAVNDEHQRRASPPETSKPTGQERTEGNRSNMASERNGDPGASEPVSEALEKTSPAVLNDESPTQENASNENPEEPEGFNNSSAGSEGSETATHAPEHTLHSNDENSTEGQNVCNLSSSDVDKRQQNCITNHELYGNTDFQTNSTACDGFTFGTVVAPLYHQVFGRVGSESRSFSDRGSRAEKTPDVEGLPQSCPHEEITEGSQTVSSDAIHNYEQTGESTAEELNRKSLDSTLNSERGMESLTVIGDCNSVEDLVDGEKSEQECKDLSAAPLLEDAKIQVNDIMGLSSAHTPEDILLLLDEPQGDNLTFDVQNHDEAEAIQNLQPEDSSSQIGTQEVVNCQQISASLSDQSGSGDATDKADKPVFSCETNGMDDSDGTGQTVAEPASLEEEKLLEAFDPEHVNLPSAGDTNNAAYCEIAEREDDAAQETLLEEEAGPEEGSDEAMSHVEEAVEVEATEEGAESPVETPSTENDPLAEFTNEAEMVLEETEQLDTGLTDSVEDKDWEMMVEEEELNILVNGGGGDALTVSIREDVGEVMELVELIVGEGTVHEKIEGVTEAEMEAPEDAVSVMGDEEGAEIASRKEEESTVETPEQVKTAESDRRDDDGGITEDDSDGRSRQEEPGNHFTDARGVDTKEADVEKGGQMETDADDEDDTPGAEQMKPEEREASEERGGEAAEAETEESERADMESQREGEGSGGALAEDTPAALLNDQEAEKEEAGEGQPETPPLEEEEDSEAGFAVVQGMLGVAAGDPESDPSSRGSSSADSDSDDEVELYMHCLRAVHAGEQANKDAGFAVSKRPAASRSKPLAAPMPSISESLDEEQHLGGGSSGGSSGGGGGGSQDAETPDTRAAPPPAPSGQPGAGRKVSWWRETFSCSNVSKALLSATLLVVFLVVAYHYDFLACLGLYLISVVWLFCHGEKQPVKNNRIG